MEEFKIIWLLAIGLGLACIFGYIAQRFKLPSILGYLVAGYCIGPYSPGYVADIAVAEQLATLGVTLLMFTVGLNFNWKDLNAVKHIALPGALLLSSLTIIIGTSYSVYLGEYVISGFVIGLAICVSSTVVMVRVLTDQAIVHTRPGHIVIGWTIVEDLISVFGLILLPALVQQSLSSDTSHLLGMGYSIFIVLLKLAALAAFVYCIGETIINKILTSIARTRSHELFTLAILACVFLLAIASSYIFGVSLALGAFIAGTIVGKTDLSHQAASNALSLRDTFAVIFFISVGMLFNPIAVTESPKLFVGVLTIILFLRPILAFLIVRIARYPIPTALTVGFAIAQIGEYSFIVAEEGSRLKVLPDNAYDILVACSFITIALNPLLIQALKFLQTSQWKLFSFHHKAKEHPHSPHSDTSTKIFESRFPKAVVIGYGLVGQETFRYLTKKGYQTLVIDRNIDTMAILKEQKINYLYGDATHFHILERAQIEHSHLLVITVPDFETTRAIIKTAQHINPFIKIIARSRFSADAKKSIFGDIPTVSDEEASSEKLIATLREQLKD